MRHNEFRGGFPLPPPEDAGDVQKVKRRTSPRSYVSNKWTPEQQTELTKHWLSQLTCAHIAKLMGLTRNQVIGRAHRTGLPRRAGFVPSAELVHDRSLKRKLYLREYRDELAAQRAERKAAARVEQPAYQPDPPVGERGATLLEVGVDRCKYPIDDGGWCGRERWHESASYCRTHHLRCHLKRKENEHA